MGVWEYTYVSAGTALVEELDAQINRLGVLGWELVNVAAVDRGIGPNVIVAFLKRATVGLDAPGDKAVGWWSDPSGRFDRRYWDGLRWTEHVVSGTGETATDPPLT